MSSPPRLLVLAIVNFFVALVIIDYFLVYPPLNLAVSSLFGWMIIVAAFALILGLQNLIRININHIIKRTPGQWYFSVWLLVCLVLMAGIGLTSGTDAQAYKWIFSTVYTNLKGAIFSLLGFFIASAAYRAFRARSIEASIMLISGCAVMLKNAPIGETIWKGFGPLGEWFLNVGLVAGTRALRIGVAIGTITYVVRLVYGLEKETLGISEGE